MGWSYGWKTREQLLAHLDRDVIKSVVVGKNHWYLYQSANGGVTIGLNLIEGGQGEWGYKDIDETMGPCEVNCPLSFLAQAGPPRGYAAEWREAVRAYHAAVKARPKPEKGLVVCYGGVEYQLLEPVGPRRGWYVQRVSDQCSFRMPARLLAQALQASSQ